MKRERGFAMLLVFVMAAAVAITLYRELPRVAFEAQRSKEQLLIERGEQYGRAIQLYVRKQKTYPATVEALEGTNSVRFLRRRYIDPFTGKSEWRIVHVGPGGVFIDSLVNKPPTKEEEKAVNTFTGMGTAEAQTGQGGPGFPQLRPSERVGIRPPGSAQLGQLEDPANPQAIQQPATPQTGFTNYQNPNQFNPNQQAGTFPAQPGVPPPPPGVPALPPGVVAPPGAYPQPGINALGGYPGAPVNSQTGGASPYSTQPGAQGAPPPFGQPGATPNPAGQPGQNQALALIDQLLRTPRAAPAAVGQQSGGGMQIGGGIGGIASMVERKGIKVYNEKEQYNEWEFLYDLAKDKSFTVAVPGMGGQQGQNQPQPGQNQQPGIQPSTGMTPPPKPPPQGRR